MQSRAQENEKFCKFALSKPEAAKTMEIDQRESRRRLSGGFYGETNRSQLNS
jgi:hypothetical protein